MSSGQAAKLHYWSLTRKRIGTRFLGLDHAGNVLLYPAYRSSWFGGWYPVTLSFETNRPQTMLMEDGHPMHHKSSKKLQNLVLERHRQHAQEVQQKLEEKIKRDMMKSKSDGVGVETPTEEDNTAIEDDLAFAKRVGKDCSDPVFVKQYLRVNRALSNAYLVLYYGLWSAAAYVCMRLYYAFKAWLNPPARKGLSNLEDKVLYYPRCVRELLDTYILSTDVVQWALGLLAEAWAPVRSAVAEVLAPFQVPWANNHQKSVAREAERERIALQEEQRRRERRTWWERSMLSLLMALIIICFLLVGMPCVVIVCAVLTLAWGAQAQTGNETTTDAPTTSTSVPSPPNTTTSAPTPTTTTVSPAGSVTGAPPGPTTEPPVCEPSCRVNLFFASFLQTSNNVQAALTAVAAAAGVGTTARISFNTRHNVYSGIPYGNGTLITVSISSFPVGTCNNVTNAEGCLMLVNRSNPPTLSSALLLMGVVNGTLIPADATIPTFGILASVSAMYLALYVGTGLGYLVFLVWSAYKFLVAFQLMMNERARDEAERVGLTLEEMEQKKRAEEEAAKQKGKKKSRGTPARAPLPLPQKEVVDPSSDRFGDTDVDEHGKQSLESIVNRMKTRSSRNFIERQSMKQDMMEREMVPVVSRRVLAAVSAAALPPIHFDASASFSIQKGGLVDLEDTLAMMQLPATDGHGEVAAAEPETFRRKLAETPGPQAPSVHGEGRSAPPQVEDNGSFVMDLPPVSSPTANERAIDALL